MAEAQGHALQRIHCQQVNPSCPDAGGKAKHAVWQGPSSAYLYTTTDMGDGA